MLTRLSPIACSSCPTQRVHVSNFRILTQYNLYGMSGRSDSHPRPGARSTWSAIPIGEYRKADGLRCKLLAEEPCDAM